MSMTEQSEGRLPASEPIAKQTDYLQPEPASAAERSVHAVVTSVGQPAFAAATTVGATPSPWSAERRPRDAFPVDRVDGIFALIAFALGFLFMRWVFFCWQGWGVSLFTVGFSGAVIWYLRRKGVPQLRSSMFWLTLLLLTGLSYALWPGNGISEWRDLFLFLIAVYWVVSATGMSLMGRTSDWLPFDGLNALVSVPLRNAGSQYRSLSILRQTKSKGERHFFSIGLGILLAAIVIAMVLPLLVAADSGGFSRIAESIWRYFEALQQGTIELTVQALLAIPTAAYLFALVVGCAHKRGARVTPEQAETALESARILPAATVHTLLALVSGLYLIFIGSQLPYFFSAFVGKRPEGWLVYSEYARNGFFELSGIAVINLVVLVLANLGGRASRQTSLALRLLNTLLATLTLLLIATAQSKMVLYIDVYGMSVRRLLPCVFMIFLAVIYACVVVLQRRSFSIMRLAAGVGAVMFCLLCLVDPDGLVTRYNANRYLAGTLPGFDVEILARSGPAGVDAALQVYERTSDHSLRAALDDYLLTQQYRADQCAGTHADSVQSALARQKIAQHRAER